MAVKGEGMERFVQISAGLDVGPALAELALRPEYWMQRNHNGQGFIQLTGGDDERLLEAELPEVWRLIDIVYDAAGANHGDRGRLAYGRVGCIPPGEGLALHFDGVDGVRERRYQLALQSDAGAEIIIDGEAKCLRPGEAWQIDVSRWHSVHNGSAIDRIVILFDTME